MPQVAKFDQKAVVLYACAQVAEGIPVNQNFWFGDGVEGYTITVTGTKVVCKKGVYVKIPPNNALTLAQIEDTDPAEFYTETTPPILEHPFAKLSVGSYLYDITTSLSKVGAESKGRVIGRIAAITPIRLEDSSTISDYNIKLEELPIEKSFITNTRMASAGNGTYKFRAGLGAKNALAALNLNASIETQSEAFQYLGDELDRDEVTIVTDRTCKFDFETFVPAFGTIENTVDLGMKFASLTAGFLTEDVLTAGVLKVTVANSGHALAQVLEAIPLNASINYINSNGDTVELGKVLKKSADDLSIDDTNKGTVPSAGTPLFLIINEDALSIPLSPFFQACGMALVLNPSASRYYVSNKKVSNTYLTVEIHHASSDLRIQDKVYTITDCRGSADLDLVIGSIPKLKFNFEGNVNQAKIAWEKLKIFANFEKQKQTRSVTLKSSSIVRANLELYSEDGVMPITVPTASNIVFNKITAPNITGFKYERVLTSEIDGWSKGGEPSDVTISILEDVSSVADVFDPHDNIEKYHKFSLQYKKNDSMSGVGSTVLITFEKLQLVKVSSGTIGSYISQDVAFRNVGKVTFSFS